MKHSLVQILSMIVVLSAVLACQKSDDKPAGASVAGSSGSGGGDESETQDNIRLPKLVSNKMLANIGHELRDIYENHLTSNEGWSLVQGPIRSNGSDVAKSINDPKNLQTLRDFLSNLSRFRAEVFTNEAKSFDGQLEKLQKNPFLSEANFKLAAEVRFISKFIDEKYQQSLDTDLASVLGPEYSKKFAVWLMKNKKVSMDPKLVTELSNDDSSEETDGDIW